MHPSIANIASPSVGKLMQMVLLGLIPGTAIFIFQTGWGSVINLSLAVATAIIMEMIAIKLRGRSAGPSLADHSAIVTGWLIALCLPPLLAWWLPVLASAFAILLGKHLFGGLGQNVFNPAMAGYALVLVSYPLDLGLWLQQPDSFSLSLKESINIVANGGLQYKSDWDALTGATPLDQHRSAMLQNQYGSVANVYGWFGAAQSEWTNLAFMAGGIWIWYKRVIQWHIPIAFLFAIMVCATFGSWINPQLAGPAFHLFGGATMLGAFFIATDPVSAAASNRGRLLYAAGAGILVYLIRTFGAYPDAVAFAILLMNCTVPATDRLDIWLRARNSSSQ